MNASSASSTVTQTAAASSGPALFTLFKWAERCYTIFNMIQACFYEEE